jgi:hypothetical protein
LAPRSSRGTAAPSERDREERILAPRLGWLTGSDTGGAVRVDFPGNRRGPLPAAALLRLSPREVDEAVRARRPALLLFDDGDPGRPILLGLVDRSPAGSLLEELLTPPAIAPTPAAPLAARVDGKRVVIEGQEEVVLRCGEATITLSRDGKVTVRGARIVSTARGTHRIRGGSVQIN